MADESTNVQIVVSESGAEPTAQKIRTVSGAIDELGASAKKTGETSLPSFYEGVEEGGVKAVGAERGIRRMEFALTTLAGQSIFARGANEQLGDSFLRLGEAALLFGGGSEAVLGVGAALAEVGLIGKAILDPIRDLSAENDKLAKNLDQVAAKGHATVESLQAMLVPTKELTSLGTQLLALGGGPNGPYVVPGIAPEDQPSWFSRTWANFWNIATLGQYKPAVAEGIQTDIATGKMEQIFLSQQRTRSVAEDRLQKFGDKLKQQSDAGTLTTQGAWDLFQGVMTELPGSNVLPADQQRAAIAEAQRQYGERLNTINAKKWLPSPLTGAYMQSYDSFQADRERERRNAEQQYNQAVQAATRPSEALTAGDLQEYDRRGREMMLPYLEEFTKAGGAVGLYGLQPRDLFRFGNQTTGGGAFAGRLPGVPVFGDTARTSPLSDFLLRGELTGRGIQFSPWSADQMVAGTPTTRMLGLETAQREIVGKAEPFAERGDPLARFQQQYKELDAAFGEHGVQPSAQKFAAGLREITKELEDATRAQEKYDRQLAVHAIDIAGHAGRDLARGDAFGAASSVLSGLAGLQKQDASGATSPMFPGLAVPAAIVSAVGGLVGGLTSLFSGGFSIRDYGPIALAQLKALIVQGGIVSFNLTNTGGASSAMLQNQIARNQSRDGIPRFPNQPVGGGR